MYELDILEFKIPNYYDQDEGQIVNLKLSNLTSFSDYDSKQESITFDPQVGDQGTYVILLELEDDYDLMKRQTLKKLVV